MYTVSYRHKTDPKVYAEDYSDRESARDYAQRLANNLSFYNVIVYKISDTGDFKYLETFAKL